MPPFPFKPGDRVYVATRRHYATVVTVRMVEGDAEVDYGEEIPDSFNGTLQREFVSFGHINLVTALGVAGSEGVEPTALDSGDEITVVYGEEKYAPKPYMNFTVGPLFAKTKVRPGETPEEAHARVWRWLEARAREQFNSQLNRFRINLQEL